jgi:hypothetical protein
MTERLYTLAQITQAADAPFAEALKQPNVDRAVRYFAQGLIDSLKALPEGAEPPPHIYHGNPPRLPQKSDL